jgi:type III secretion protein Q
MTAEPGGLSGAVLPTQAPALWLERHDSALLALHNRLHRRRQPWRGQCAGQAVVVQWGSAAQPIPDAREVLLGLGDSRVRVRLPGSVLEQLKVPLAVAHPASALNALPNALLLELALLTLIEPLERLLGQAVQVSDDQGLDQRRLPFVLSLSLKVTFGQQPEVDVQLDLTGASAQVIADLLDSHATPAPADPAVHWPLAVDAGSAWLSLGELRSLLPGDVVMIDQPQDAEFNLALDGRLQARARLEGSGVRLQEKLMAVNPTREPFMTDVVAAPGVDAILDDLPLKLVCQVGSVELSLAQLRELGTGSLLQLTPDVQDGVDLMVNGRRIGQGQSAQGSAYAF